MGLTTEQKTALREEVVKPAYADYVKTGDYDGMAAALNAAKFLPGELAITLDVAQNYLLKQKTPQGLPLVMVIEETAALAITPENVQLRCACWVINRVVWHSRLANVNLRNADVQAALGALVAAGFATQEQLDGLSELGVPDRITVEDVMEALR